MAEATPALEAIAVHRFFRVGGEETTALKDVTFDVQAGELVVVAGPSGSGKSTLLACLAGIDEPDAGTVAVCGERMSGQPELARTRLRRRLIGFLFQSGNLFEHLTVAANIALAQSLTDRSEENPDLEEVLRCVGLADRGLHHPSALSGGETARAGLAVAIANRPSVLLADEPTGELDTAAEDSVLHLLLDAADRGTAVVVASHGEAVAAAADRVLLLRDGVLTE